MLRTPLKAVCIRCGNWKLQAKSACASCRFLPLDHRDVARSFILSVYQDVGEELVGRPSQELRFIAQEIRSGRRHTFSSIELERVMRMLHHFPEGRFPQHSPAWGRWLLTPAFLLAAAYVAYACIH